MLPLVTASLCRASAFFRHELLTRLNRAILISFHAAQFAAKSY